MTPEASTADAGRFENRIIPLVGALCTTVVFAVATRAQCPPALGSAIITGPHSCARPRTASPAMTTTNLRSVLVVGAGLAGVTTAWYLARAGLRVTVIERQRGPAMETSHANGGQISISHPEPWSSPAAPALLMRWLGRADAPVRLHPGFDAERWRWLLGFLRECLPARHARNTEAIARLAIHSGACLRALRAETKLHYHEATLGTLHLVRDVAALAHARRKHARLAQLGIEARLLTREECLSIEPALAGFGTALYAGLHAPLDESGDAAQFTTALALRAEAAGVRFMYGWHVARLVVEGGAARGVHIDHPDHGHEKLFADACVACMGSHGHPLLTPWLGRLPVQPLKGYSITLPVVAPERAPRVSLTDEALRIVCTRLGDRLRVAGTAELCGHDTHIDAERTAPLERWAQALFPGATDAESCERWAGLRPATPSNVPLIGASRLAGLWLNMGHGSLGWTMACGASDLLAALMQGRIPPLPADPYAPS